MKKKSKSIQSQILFYCLLFTCFATAQVGIGTTTPASGALLDLNDPNRGLLVPRVTIADLATAAPVTAPTTGLLVWNLEIITGVGFHYWDSSAWVPIGGSAIGNNWSLTGNAITAAGSGNITTDGTTFIGTTSNHNLNFKTNGVFRGRLSNLGEFFIGTRNTVMLGDLMNAVGNATFPWAINGYSNLDGSGVYGAVTLDGTQGTGGTTSYPGVQGEYMGTNYLGPGVRGLTFQHNTPGQNFVGSTISGVHGSLSGGSVDITSTYYLDRAFGVMGTTGNNFAPRTGGVIGTDYIASAALGYYASNTLSYGVYAFGNPRANGGAGGRLSFNSQLDTHVGIGINGGFLGGWIKGDKYGAMFSGDSFGIYTHGKSITNETFIVLDEKSDGNKLATYASTSLSIDVQSKGIGQLNNGSSRILFDKNFMDLVDENKPIIVTITPFGESNGVHLISVDKTGFVIKENNRGSSNVKFNYIAIAEKSSKGKSVSEELLSRDFDKNTQLFMHDDTLEEDATAIWFENGVIHYGEKAPTNNTKLENFEKLPEFSRPTGEKKE